MTRTSPRTRSRIRARFLAVALASGLAMPLLPISTASAASAAGSSSAAPAKKPGGETPTQVRQTAPVLDLPAGFRPEGITAARGALYVSSLADGRILALDPRSGGRKTLLAGVPGRALRGMQIDDRSGILYVTGSQGDAGLVLAVDLDSGDVVRTWTLDDAGFLNDLVVTPHAVWVTDSRVDRLARIPLDHRGRPADADVELLTLRGSWPVPNPQGNRANGIRALSDGTLLLDHSTAGGLWTVDPAHGTVHKVPVTGGPAITGGDGVELAGHHLWIVRGTSQTSVTELRIDSDHGRVTARWLRTLTNPSLDVPSTAVLAGGRLWAVNARFGVLNPGQAGYWVTGLSLGR